MPPWWWLKLSPLPPWYSRIHHTIPSSESILILAGYFGGDVLEWVVLLLLVVVGRWGFRLWVWVEIKSWVWVEIGLCLCLWSGSVKAFVFVVRIGDDVFVYGRDWAVFVLVVGIRLSLVVGLCLWFVFMVEICEFEHNTELGILSAGNIDRCHKDTLPSLVLSSSFNRGKLGILSAGNIDRCRKDTLPSLVL
ncbi:hypothetical protein SO802_001924 [Lithocarpus litseifolius]|uniref:Transmembrane protein n=1 Tax=Lithocarpus litseifolius TaxID=425828 RepID=A0AAW2DZT5_9ROSI